LAAQASQQLAVVLAAGQPEVVAVPVVLRQEAAVPVALLEAAAVAFAQQGAGAVVPAAAAAVASVVPQQAGSVHAPLAEPAQRASAEVVSRVVLAAAPIASRPAMAGCVLQAASEAEKSCLSRRKVAAERQEEAVAARFWSLGWPMAVRSGRPSHPLGRCWMGRSTMGVACWWSTAAVARCSSRAKVVQSACCSNSEVR
jgi:hypothetical protein